jgi:hypothetical protein
MLKDKARNAKKEKELIVPSLTLRICPVKLRRPFGGKAKNLPHQLD